MKQFLKSMLSPDGEVSSKRFMGLVVVFFVFVCFLLSLFVDFKNWQQAFLDKLLVSGLALMGLTALDKFIGIFKK